MRAKNLRLLLKASALVGIEDMKSFYTWQTWVFGWLLRIVFQVLFFTMLGRYVGQPETVRFLLVGGAAAVAVLETMVIVLFTADDRHYGTLPLLASAPGNYFAVLLARNVHIIATGTVTSSIALFSCALVVDVPLSYPQALLAVPILALGAVASYVFGVFLSALIANVVTGRWVMLNAGYMGLTALCGFVIPVGHWPAPLPQLAEVLPFTHALRALRELLFVGGSPGTILAQVGLEFLVAIGWFIVARIAFRISLDRARRNATIELSAA